MKALRSVVIVLAAAVWVSAPRLSRAEPAVVRTTAEQASELVVWVDTRGGHFDPEQLRASLVTELGREVRLTSDAGTAQVRVRLEGEQRADVRYTTPSGEELSRSVDLPPDRARAVQVVSWLTVNLVRDEASELLTELRARRREEAARAAERAAAERAAAEAVKEAEAAREAAAKNSAARAKPAENGAGGPPPADGLLREPLRSFDLALATPLSLVPDSAKRELYVQLALGYGDSGAVRGVGVSAGALRVRRGVRGALVSPAFVLVGERARGAVVSAYVQVDGALQGVLVGGGAVVQRGPLARGVAVAGGGAVLGHLTGVVLGGGLASAKSLRGAAAAGGLTFIRGRSEGALLAGGVNLSAEHSGVEVAGGLNAAQSLTGVALAPVNVHRRVKGLQLGLVNIAEEVDGAALGLISYAKNGRLQPTLWTSTEGSAHVALKSVVGYAFTQLGAGVEVRSASFTYEGGVGAHLRLTDSVFLEPGVHYSGKHRTEGASAASEEHRLHYLAQLGYRVGNKLDLLVAAGARHAFAGGVDKALVPELRLGVALF